MIRKPASRPVMLAWLLACTAPLCACDADTSAWAPGKTAPPADAVTESGYVAPPKVTSAARTSTGVVLSGTALPGVRVRLGPPAGDAVFAMADKTGAWSLALPASDAVRLYGLSMAEGQRAVQSEGYLMVLPEGQALQLRAGAGAWSLAAPSAAPRLMTIDHDAEGGAVISGSATASGSISARIDRSSVANGHVMRDGHFDLALSEPLKPGVHEIELVGDGGRDALSAPISAAQPLQAPFRSERTPFGWRVDWMTPAGGVQTTLVFQRAKGAGA